MKKSDITSPHATLSTYVIGFVFSLYLTLTAYWFTTNNALSEQLLIAMIISLAIVQFFIQAWFFLHIGKEARPRWNLLIFSFMIMVVAILVGGSLWIMANLDYHHKMSPAETSNKIIRDEGIDR